MISIIAAISQNDIIGKKGAEPLLWRLEDELQLFKKATTGQVIVMGRSTMRTLRKPLPNRTNIVLSRTLPPGEMEEGFIVENSIAGIIEKYPKFIVIGGEEVYNQFIDIADEVILTTIGLTVHSKDKDVFAYFPTAKLEDQFYLIFESKVMVDFDKISESEVDYIVTRWHREIKNKH